jgi:hypothetical protein
MWHVWGRNVQERHHVEDVTIVGSIVLQQILKKKTGGEEVDWIDMTDDWSRRRTVVNFRVP